MSPEEKADNFIDELPTRMKEGQSFTGPDFYGCMNTGTRPVIYKSINYGKVKPIGTFLVGQEIDIQDAGKQLLYGKTSHKTKHKMPTGRYVYYCRTYAAAKKRFRAILLERLQENESVRKEHQQALEDAKSNDPDTKMKGIAKLADF